jgi:hypothetical protein
LERREVFVASLDSVLAIGNDDVTGVHVARDVETDSAGNSYLTGAFSGTVDFDLGATHANDADILTARGSADVFVAKYAPDNSLVWVTRMGGDLASTNETDIGRKIAVDAAGTVYVAGQFVGSADFGSTALSTTGPEDYDGFVAKLTSSGTVLWANWWRTMPAGGIYGDNAYGVGVDGAGNVYALGTRPNAGDDVRKFSPSGALLWTKSVQTTYGGARSDMVVSASGDVFVAGAFKGTVDFDPSSKTKNVSSGPSFASYVWKLNTDGKLSWISPFVSTRSYIPQIGYQTGFSNAHAISLDPSGNVIVGGNYMMGVDFDPNSIRTYMLPSSPDTGYGGGYIVKLTSSGSFLWAKALTAGADVNGIDVDAAGSIYATGRFSTTSDPLDLDPGPGSVLRTAAGSDVFVVKLNSSGNYQWGETFGGQGGDWAYGISVDTTGLVHVAGYFQNTVDFDPDPLTTYELTAPGTSKGFRLRLRQS